MWLSSDLMITHLPWEEFIWVLALSLAATQTLAVEPLHGVIAQWAYGGRKKKWIWFQRALQVGVLFFIALFSDRKYVFCFYSLVSKIYIFNIQGSMDSVDIMLSIHNYIFSNEFPLLINSVLKHAQSNPT